MLKSRQRIAWLALSAAALLLASCSGPAAPAPAATAPPIPEDAYPEVPRVGIEEAKAAFDDGSAVFVDVRSARDYELAHIPGAINIFYASDPSQFGVLDKAEWIITYCT